MFRGRIADLAERRAFLRHLSPVRKKRWVVYAKPPFAGPQALLVYLSRHTHRVAISNWRLIAFDETGVTLRYKDYRRDGAERQQVMTLATDEFIRRFLLHVLPRGFHRIRHYGLLASSTRKASLVLARKLLEVAPDPNDTEIEEPAETRPPCPCCGGVHGRDRNVRALAPALRAAFGPTTAPGDHAMTRHGLTLNQLAIMTLWASAAFAPGVADAAPGREKPHPWLRSSTLKVPESSPSTSWSFCHLDASPYASHHRNPKPS